MTPQQNIRCIPGPSPLQIPGATTTRRTTNISSRRHHFHRVDPALRLDVDGRFHEHYDRSAHIRQVRPGFVMRCDCVAVCSYDLIAGLKNCDRCSLSTAILSVIPLVKETGVVLLQGTYSSNSLLFCII